MILEIALEIYLVGGAVRDELLGRPVKERDWVVVGAAPEQMLALGYKPVGKDFPVFIHPQSGEEYALARTERKSGRGYSGFTFHAAADVTLQDDLRRRDLTINAIAKSSEGELIDPFHGQQDLRAGWLRHVSDAFVEDPVRLLRVARFTTTLTEFNVHPSTLTLLKRMVSSGEVNYLVPERMFREFERALGNEAPQRFFEILMQCLALAVIFPELADYNPLLPLLKKATAITTDTTLRYATMLGDLDENTIKSLCQRLRVPRDYRELALLVSRHKKSYQQLLSLSAAEVHTFLKTSDALRRPERFEKCLTALQVFVDATTARNNAALLHQALQAMQAVAVQPLLDQGLSGAALAVALDQQRLAAIEKSIKK